MRRSSEHVHTWVGIHGTPKTNKTIKLLQNNENDIKDPPRAPNQLDLQCSCGVCCPVPQTRRGPVVEAHTSRNGLRHETESAACALTGAPGLRSVGYMAAEREPDFTELVHITRVCLADREYYRRWFSRWKEFCHLEAPARRVCAP